MSIAGKRKSTFGPGHDGARKPESIAQPGQEARIDHTPNNMNGRHSGLSDIARNGAPKQHIPVPVHGGMHSRQIAGAGFGGMAHGTAVVSGGQTIPNSAAAVPPVPPHRAGFNSAPMPNKPITHAYGSGAPKVRGPAPTKPGMARKQGDIARSLNDSTPHSILGRALLDEAKR